MNMNVIRNPYCTLATTGFSEMKLPRFLGQPTDGPNRGARCSGGHGKGNGKSHVNIFRRMENGSGTMRSTNSTISVTSSIKTCGELVVSTTLSSG
jgi:hypothetical protein